MKVGYEEITGTLPAEWPTDELPEIRRLVREAGATIVVIDDDPTGTQTVYDVPVLTDYSPERLTPLFEEGLPLLYVLTNSRSVAPAEAAAMNREVASSLLQARAESGRDFVVVSRSDSTLRGHYPGEVDALTEALGLQPAATVIAPFFLEGGRFTVGDIHYVAEGDYLVPAAETEFARDRSFGYRSSNLREWLAEKQEGRLLPEDVISISLDDIRSAGPDRVAEILEGTGNNQPCVVNALSYRDMEVVVAGLLRAEARGKRFLYRTAASFVRVRAGLSPRGLLTREELAAAMARGSSRGSGRKSRGGLVVAGSYVEKSSRQLAALRELSGVGAVELDVNKILSDAEREHALRASVEELEQLLSRGSDAVLYTSRTLVTGDSASSSLSIGRSVSRALVAAVRQLSVQPAWVVAKGGITSYDVARSGLGLQQAQVLGQAIPGVPVWQTGLESRWTGLLYVVFPGNVGGDGAIREMVMLLRSAR